MNGPGLLVDESVWNWKRTKDKGKAHSSSPCSLVCDTIDVHTGTNLSTRESRIDCTTALIGRMSHKILGPKVYDPTLAKKILGRTEPTFSERLKHCQDSAEMSLQQFHNDDVNEEALVSPKDALEQFMFRNVPDATLQLCQERQRREVCSSKLQEIERDLQDFSEAFGSKLVDLKKSMGEFAKSMKELLHYDEGNYIEDRLWEEADANSKTVGIVVSNQSPPHR